MIRAPRVLVVAVTFVAIAFPATAQNEVTERFSKTAHLDQNGTFDLTNISGNVVITGSSGRDVTIEAVKRVQRPNPNAARALLQMIDIQVAEQANRVEVRTVFPRPRNFPGSVDFTIGVPDEANVTLKMMSGNVRATNISGGVRADVVTGNLVVAAARRIEALKSVSGDIEIVDASADDFVTVSTVSGNITVRGLKGRTVQLGTVSGNVRMDDVQSDRLMARAVNGNIDYAGDLARSGRYEFVSHSGDIRLMLSGGTGFEVQANSFSGNVRSDFPVNRRAGAEGGGGVTPRGIRGVFGDASAMLVLRAFSGNISIARR
jgi:DUF4097 and DUF4098 domain-containing protein YvlB